MRGYECYQCGYDLTPLASGADAEVRCPECGATDTPIEKSRPLVVRLRSFRRAMFMPLVAMQVVGIVLPILASALEYEVFGSSDPRSFQIVMQVFTVACAVLVPVFVGLGRVCDPEWRFDRGRVWAMVGVGVVINLVIAGVGVVIGFLIF